ncbi:glycerophosphodiester phosphodiesterase [Alicyclobacillus dauci]|uniref:Glycerophosphodiester phosphodiesterase n=1 Tax=Alicyclobacillus dauci TaxID=1475485 RepID=A0ABY6Z146_9BACL|nr:glycerophosphodiester phosphodiesterase [Alicyclobacillus dauci]WAH36313.1 glycerophosphodiester phosphodiesterase [Alicyclobacillus dauci]
MTISIAHRGDPIRFRENTIEAFKSAISLGADMIELDVKPSRDGKAVILHDDTLDRLWNIPHRVRDLSYTEIQGLCDSDKWQIPLFEDVLRTIKQPIMVDFTDLDTVDCIVETIRRMEAAHRCLIVTGNTDALREVRRQMLHATLGLTWNDSRLPSDELIEELDVAYFNPDWRLLRDPAENRIGFSGGQRTVDFFHQRGIRVSCWTVDDKDDMDFVYGLGVDAITTNDTKTLMEVLNSEG